MAHKEQKIFFLARFSTIYHDPFVSPRHSLRAGFARHVRHLWRTKKQKIFFLARLGTIQHDLPRLPPLHGNKNIFQKWKTGMTGGMDGWLLHFFCFFG
jgi:hypothetical protein